GPASAREVTPDSLRDEDVDVVVLQRERDLELVREWLGREPGRDLPAVFLEHNAPDGGVPDTRHPLADRDDIPIAHVTFFNQLFYDNGRAPTTVIEHGIVDPGERWTGELARAAVVVNEPVRRGRTTGRPVVGVAPAGAVEAVRPGAGVLSTNPDRLWTAVREFLHDQDAARLAGKAARAAALERYGLARFLRDWDALLEEVTR